MRRRSKKAYQDCFKKWKHLGISVCVGEESNLKGIQTCNFQIKYIFYNLSPRTVELNWKSLLYMGLGEVVTRFMYSVGLNFSRVDLG